MLKFNHHHISVFHITIFQAAAINSFPFSPWRKNLYYLSFSSLLVLILFVCPVTLVVSEIHDDLFHPLKLEAAYFKRIEMFCISKKAFFDSKCHKKKTPHQQ